MFAFQVKNGFGQRAGLNSPRNQHLWRTWVIEFRVQHSILLCFCTVLGALCESGEETAAGWTVVLKGSAQGQQGKVQGCTMTTEGGKSNAYIRRLLRSRGFMSAGWKNVTYPSEWQWTLRWGLVNSGWLCLFTQSSVFCEEICWWSERVEFNCIFSEFRGESLKPCKCAYFLWLWNEMMLSVDHTNKGLSHFGHRISSSTWLGLCRNPYTK